MKLSRLLLPALAAFAFTTQAVAADKFRVGYMRVMDDAQAITAYEGGLYKKHGLDVELVEFKSGTDLIKAIVGGQLDTGVLGFTNAASWSSRGADLKVVGGAQHGYHAIVVRDDAGINEVKDLKGKTLASQKEGSTADTVLKGVVLTNAGLAPSDVNIMGVSPQVAVQSLVGKRVDAAFLFEPQASIAKLIAPVTQIYEIGEVWPFPCMVVITAGDTLKTRKDDVWKSLDAQREAIDLLQNKPAEAAKLIAGYFVAEPTIKTLKNGEVAREDVIQKAIESQTFSPVLTSQELARMQEIADIMQKQGSLKTRDGNPFDVSKIVDLNWQQARKL
ncbi:ABC transporter substrate-binding protein [Allopusillimonas ginsengisoli]|uniref:ABC transporter substrate-binding protein n=1 Tax=Allopusillimonas ginsengisoli TaxID=453575 RepID=UPI0010C1B521|nr:ABC transporter substrate-binding protein [Allopusillimonas ginsengisoli]